MLVYFWHFLVLNVLMGLRDGMIFGGDFTDEPQRRVGVWM